MAEEPDYCMMDYKPYHGGWGDQDFDSQTLVYLKRKTVYSQDRKDEFISRIQEWLKQQIDHIRGRHPEKTIIFGFAPGHSPESAPSFMVTELNIKGLCEDQKFFVDIIF